MIFKFIQKDFESLFNQNMNVSREDLINFIKNPFCKQSNELFTRITGDYDIACLYPPITNRFNIDGSIHTPTLLEEFIYEIREGIILGIDPEYYISRIDEVLREDKDMKK